MLKEINMTDIFIAPKRKEGSQKSFSDRPSHSSPIEHKKVNIFSTFSEKPKGISFQSQGREEEILLFLRAHIITNFSWVFASLLLLILPVILFAILPNFGINLFVSLNIARYTMLYLIFYYSLIFSYILTNFIHWFYNVFIVTTEQVVDVDYSNIVIHYMAVTGLNHVQDAKYSQTGFIATFFDFGNIFVQTAGTEPNFEESAIPKPKEATQIIGDVISKRRLR